MSFDPISAAMDLGGKLIDRLWPDPAAAQAAKIQLFQLQQTGELAQLTADTDLAKAQAQIDAAEAASVDPLQHWRGGLGWVCTASFAWTFVLQPFVGVALAIYCAKSGIKDVPQLPVLDTTALMSLTLGMLGLGGMHVYQQVTGNSGGSGK